VHFCCIGGCLVCQHWKLALLNLPIEDCCCLCIGQVLKGKGCDAMGDVVKCVAVLEFACFWIIDEVWPYGVLDVHICALGIFEVCIKYVHVPTVCVGIVGCFQKVGSGLPSGSPHQLYMLVSLMLVMAGALLGMAVSSDWQAC